MLFRISYPHPRTLLKKLLLIAEAAKKLFYKSFFFYKSFYKSLDNLFLEKQALKQKINYHASIKF